MNLSKSKQISLWLLPPEPQLSRLTAIQEEIISSHLAHRNLPKFTPHLTMIGGVPISDCVSVEEASRRDDVCGDIDEKAAHVVVKRLQDAFRGYGGINIEFLTDSGVFAAFNNVEGRETIQWNQSCVCLVRKNEEFMDAMAVADKTLFQKEMQVDRHFKPPVSAPHFSYVYGNIPQHISKSLNCPPSFRSENMVVVWTFPSTLEGVSKWRVIDHVHLM
mmetsp:Transcript_4016/g.8633  ORF Transcript_4016/g.8633 Transcript_4016/m.8633 type:complete len:218 (-) Transcript_4016:1269-1922(-)